MPFSPDKDISFPELVPRRGGGGHGGGGHSSGHSSSSGKGSSSSSSSKSSSFHFSSGSTKKSSSASAYSSGGGKRYTLPSSSPFQGRQAGGGTRDTIYGTGRYGSGYPYGGSGSYVTDRPFPYTFWPVYWPNNYYGSNTYADRANNGRPGGNMTTVSIQSASAGTNETYHLVGDNASVLAVYDALTSNCSIANTTGSVASFDPASPSAPLHPEQVIQYYRSSSFALALDGYNNTANLASSAPQSNDTAPPPASADVPLPSYLNVTFLACLNSTIAASVPLVDQPKGLSKGIIATIVICSLVGAFFLVVIIMLAFDKWQAVRDTRARRRWSKTSVRSVSVQQAKPVSRLSKMFARITPKRGRYTSLETPPTRSKELHADVAALDVPQHSPPMYENDLPKLEASAARYDSPWSPSASSGAAAFPEPSFTHSSPDMDKTQHHIPGRFETKLAPSEATLGHPPSHSALIYGAPVTGAHHTRSVLDEEVMRFVDTASDLMSLATLARALDS